MVAAAHPLIELRHLGAGQHDRLDDPIGDAAIAADANLQSPASVGPFFGQPLGQLRNVHQAAAEAHLAIGLHVDRDARRLGVDILFAAASLRQGQLELRLLLHEVACEQEEDDELKDDIDHRRHIEADRAMRIATRDFHGRSMKWGRRLASPCISTGRLVACPT
jgi:hypothetical protein